MLLSKGSKVRIKGIEGFAIVREFLYAFESKFTLVKLDLYNNNPLIPWHPITILADDILPYTVAESTAKRIAPHPDDAELAALRMDMGA